MLIRMSLLPKWIMFIIWLIMFKYITISDLQTKFMFFSIMLRLILMQKWNNQYLIIILYLLDITILYSDNYDNYDFIRLYFQKLKDLEIQDIKKLLFKIQQW